MHAALRLPLGDDAFGGALGEFFRAVVWTGRDGVAALVDADDADAAGLGGASPASEKLDEAGEAGGVPSLSLSASVRRPFWMAHARRVACACDDCRCNISGVTLRL